MKLSEMQKILKEYEDKYGDIEIKLRYENAMLPVEKTNFSATADNREPYEVKYITFWV